MSGKEVLYRLTRTARAETAEIEPVVTKKVIINLTLLPKNTILYMMKALS